MAHSYENQFGPPSDLIDVAQFIQSTTVAAPDSAFWEQLPNDTKTTIEAECRCVTIRIIYILSEREQYSVSDIKSSILDIINDPRLFSHVSKSHQVTVGQIYDSADTSNRRKRKRPTFADPAEEIAEVTELQKKLDATPLRSSP
jgi:snRNA-activating protein complex subunit 3